MHFSIFKFFTNAFQKGLALFLSSSCFFILFSSSFERDTTTRRPNVAESKSRPLVEITPGYSSGKKSNLGYTDLLCNTVLRLDRVSYNYERLKGLCFWENTVLVSSLEIITLLTNHRGLVMISLSSLTFGQSRMIVLLFLVLFILCLVGGKVFYISRLNEKDDG